MKVRFSRMAAILCGSVVVLLVTIGPVRAQLVINEYVYDDSGGDDREFVELYNASGADLDVSGWSLVQLNGSDGAITTTDTIPDATVLPAGGFWVIGQASVPNVDQIASGSFQNSNEALEVRDPAGARIDAVIYEANKGVENFPFDLIDMAGGGWWGNVTSIDRTFQSTGRWRDGRSSNVNGRDFGLIPQTPGGSNDLPYSPSYSVPDVDGLAAPIGSDVPDMQASFVLPKVIDPNLVDALNPNPIPPSPQGGAAIVAWDPSGGGNMAAATEMGDQYLISAYIDTRTYGPGGAESTTYGIGTTGTFYNFPDPSGQLLGGATANGNTGVGWLFEKEDSAGLVTLYLIDFGKGGNSSPDTDEPQEWKVIVALDMTEGPSDWHTLGIDYDPQTGDVVAVLDEQEFNFTTDAGLLGTFYVGYRESLQGTDEERAAKLRPPTFDVVPIPEPASFGLLLAGTLILLLAGRRRRK